MKKKFESKEEERKILIADIKDFFLKETDQEIGDLRAELVLDFFLEKIGAKIYNLGVNDARKWFREKFDDLDADFYLLEK